MAGLEVGVCGVKVKITDNITFEKIEAVQQKAAVEKQIEILANMISLLEFRDYISQFISEYDPVYKGYFSSKNILESSATQKHRNAADIFAAEAALKKMFPNNDVSEAINIIFGKVRGLAGYARTAWRGKGVRSALNTMLPMIPTEQQKLVRKLDKKTVELISTCDSNWGNQPMQLKVPELKKVKEALENLLKLRLGGGGAGFGGGVGAGGFGGAGVGRLSLADQLSMFGQKLKADDKRVFLPSGGVKGGAIVSGLIGGKSAENQKSAGGNPNDTFDGEMAGMVGIFGNLSEETQWLISLNHYYKNNGTGEMGFNGLGYLSSSWVDLGVKLGVVRRWNEDNNSAFSPDGTSVVFGTNVLFSPPKFAGFYANAGIDLEYAPSYTIVANNKEFRQIRHYYGVGVARGNFALTAGAMFQNTKRGTQDQAVTDKNLDQVNHAGAYLNGIWNPTDALTLGLTGYYLRNLERDNPWKKQYSDAAGAQAKADIKLHKYVTLEARAGVEQKDYLMGTTGPASAVAVEGMLGIRIGTDNIFGRVAGEGKGEVDSSDLGGNHDSQGGARVELGVKGQSDTSLMRGPRAYLGVMQTANGAISSRPFDNPQMQLNAPKAARFPSPIEEKFINIMRVYYEKVETDNKDAYAIRKELAGMEKPDYLYKLASKILHQTITGDSITAALLDRLAGEIVKKLPADIKSKIQIPVSTPLPPPPPPAPPKTGTGTGATGTSKGTNTQTPPENRGEPSVEPPPPSSGSGAKLEVPAEHIAAAPDQPITGEPVKKKI